MDRKIEILAPAGSLEAMEAAMEAGCDAVYIGGSSFGARAYADNLSEEQLLAAIDYAHLHGKSLYLTVNTLLKDSELEQRLYRYMKPFYEQGLDAAIVQDVGVLRFLHTHFPELPLHVSTQMTVTAAGALQQLKGMGVTRVVTSRELSMEEVREIRRQTDLEIESFVHGALCYSYSGQCLFSSMLGGRSGNRGRCTQPCRMEYQVLDGTEKKLASASARYVLSPKDICTLEQIPELIEAGIDSFKIEGRMKRPEYAALTARMYRKWADRYLEWGADRYQEYQKKNPTEMAEDIRMLADLYNRGGFSGGYYQQKNGPTMMSMNRPNHHGVEVVRVESVRKNVMELKAIQPLNAQDVIEIRRNGQAEYEFTLKDAVPQGATFISRFLPESRITPGQSGFRTKNAALLDVIREGYLEHREKLPIYGIFHAEAGKPMELQLWRPDREDRKVCCLGAVAEQAKNQPVAPERVEQALRKTGDSFYEWEDLQIDLQGDLFLAMSAVNQLRRDGITMLEEHLLAEYRRDTEKSCELQEKPIGEDIRQTIASREPQISIGVEREEQWQAALMVDGWTRVYLSAQEMTMTEIRSAISVLKERGKEIYLRLPRIFRQKTERDFEKHGTEWMDILQQVDGVLLHNMESITWIESMREQLPQCKIQLGENLYTWNREARRFWQERGVSDYTTSVELTREDLSSLDLSRDEMIVYGYLPLMVSAQCVMCNSIGCGLQKRENEYLYLLDQKNRKYPVMNVCRYCYNMIYQNEPLNLFACRSEIMELGCQRVRLEFTLEGKQEVRRILTSWKKGEVLSGGTEGHFRRGVE